mgnify:CR=1 FL=1
MAMEAHLFKLVYSSVYLVKHYENEVIVNADILTHFRRNETHEWLRGMVLLCVFRQNGWWSRHTVY